MKEPAYRVEARYIDARRPDGWATTPGDSFNYLGFAIAHADWVAKEQGIKARVVEYPEHAVVYEVSPDPGDYEMEHHDDYGRPTV